MRAILIAAFLLGSGAAAAAQDAAVTEPQCWFASMSFSPGVTLRAGEDVMKCEPGGSWSANTASASGCIRDGRFYSVGAIQIVANTQDRALVCAADGTWKPEL